MLCFPQFNAAGDSGWRIEELLRANGRARSEVEIAVSNSGKPITVDDLKRYRDAGVEEFVFTGMRARPIRPKRHRPFSKRLHANGSSRLPGFEVRRGHI